MIGSSSRVGAGERTRDRTLAPSGRKKAVSAWRRGGLAGERRPTRARGRKKAAVGGGRLVRRRPLAVEDRLGRIEPLHENRGPLEDGLSSEGQSANRFSGGYPQGKPPGGAPRVSCDERVREWVLAKTFWVECTGSS